MLRIFPLDTETILKLTENFKYILIAEEGIQNGGVAEQLCCTFNTLRPQCKIEIHALCDFTPHGKNDDLLRLTGLSAEKLAEALNNG